MFPIMGNPFGPGGYGSFLLDLNKKIQETSRRRRRKSNIDEDCRDCIDWRRRSMV
jgi:hypothetical protein